LKTTAEETEALREVVRQAHEAIQDMTRLIREAREITAKIRVAAAITVDDRIGDAITDGLAEYHDTIVDQIKKASDTVIHRFETIEQTLLGETAEQRARNQPTLAEISEVWREAIGLVRTKQREVDVTIESKYLKDL
jgi:predicted transcriptional regulator